MNYFTSARIRLTAWYLCIIMLISIMFSFSIYHILTQELERGFHRVIIRYYQQYQPTPNVFRTPIAETSYLQASEDRIKWTLIYINFVIFIVSGIGGYVLAGLTLKPIRQMIDGQNHFIADASHELNTPLTTLRSEIEVYLRSEKHTIKEADKLIESNLEEVNSLQQLIDGLITLAKHSNSNNNVYSEIPLGEVINEVIKKFQKPIKQKEISLQVNIGDGKIIGNREKLLQVFGILLDNAIKYSHKKTTISIQEEKADGEIKISVCDQGIGISEIDLPHIFNRFYRADSSRSKQDINGYGLGLSIAKKIIEEHHGNIRAKSESGKGTIFTISLPLAK